MTDPSHQQILDKIDTFKVEVTDRMARVEVTLEGVKEKTKENSEAVNSLKDKFTSNEGYVKGFFKFGSILAGVIGLVFVVIKFFGG